MLNLAHNILKQHAVLTIRPRVLWNIRTVNFLGNAFQLRLISPQHTLCATSLDLTIKIYRIPSNCSTGRLDQFLRECYN